LLQTSETLSVDILYYDR